MVERSQFVEHEPRISDSDPDTGGQGLGGWLGLVTQDKPVLGERNLGGVVGVVDGRDHVPMAGEVLGQVGAQGSVSP